MKATLWRGFLCLLVAALAGCSAMGQNLMSARSLEPAYGWISPWGIPVADDATSRNIEFGHLDPGMNYYYSDSPSLPPAVVRISKEYVMNDVHWKPITDPETLMEVIQAIKAMDGTRAADDFRSFTMKAPDTRPIGTWYSTTYVYGMKLREAENKQLSLAVPNFKDTRTYYVRRGKGSVLSQGMTTSPEMQNADSLRADAPL